MPRAGDAVFNRPPTDPVTPLSDLIAATLAFYLRAFRPLFIATATISVALSIVVAAFGQVAESDSLSVFVTLVVVIGAANVAAFSGVFWLAVSLRQGHPGTAAGVIGAIVFLGPRFFAGAFLILALVVLLFTVLGLLAIPFAIYVFVRVSLFWPAVVVENRSLVLAAVRSWRLTRHRWLRTFAIEAFFIFPISAIQSLASVVVQGLGTIPTIIVAVVLTAVTSPLLVLLSLVLFEDYARASEQQLAQQLQDGPPTDNPPPP